MAPNSATRLLKLSLLLLLAMAIGSEAQYGGEFKETKIVVYFQDRSVGPNTSVVSVGGISGKLWGFLEFGSVFCTDDPLTEGLDPNSKPVGRGQGLYVTSALDGSTAHVLISVIFTNMEYNGSTIQIQGASHQLAKVREVSVVSGTGIFRLARGYATFETVYLDNSIGYSVIRCNLTVLHY